MLTIANCEVVQFIHISIAEMRDKQVKNLIISLLVIFVILDTIEILPEIVNIATTSVLILQAVVSGKFHAFLVVMQVG